MDAQCGEGCVRNEPHPMTDLSCFGNFLESRGYLHLLGLCGRELNPALDEGASLQSRKKFLSMLFWEQMKFLFSVYPIAGVPHRNFMAAFTIRESIREEYLLMFMPEMYRGIFPLRNLPDEDEVSMGDVDFDEEVENFNSGWPGMPAETLLETPETLTPFKRGTDAPARRPRPEPLSEEMVNFGRELTRSLFTTERLETYSPVLRPRVRTLAVDLTDDECTASCAESCAKLGAGAGAGAGSGAGSSSGSSSDSATAFARYVMGTPPRPAGMKRKGDGKGKRKVKKRVVMETPEHKRHRREAKIARMRAIGVNIPATPAHSPEPISPPCRWVKEAREKSEKRNPKRRTEVENLQRAEAFMPKGPEVLPTKRTGTSSNPHPIYTEPTEEELIAELEAYELGSAQYDAEPLDGAGSDTGAEWIMTFQEGMAHLDEIRSAMSKDMTMLEKRALQREEASLMRYLRKLSK